MIRIYQWSGVFVLHEPRGLSEPDGCAHFIPELFIWVCGRTGFSLTHSSEQDRALEGCSAAIFMGWRVWSLHVCVHCQHIWPWGEGRGGQHLEAVCRYTHFHCTLMPYDTTVWQGGEIIYDKGCVFTTRLCWAAHRQCWVVEVDWSRNALWWAVLELYWKVVTSPRIFSTHYRGIWHCQDLLSLIFWCRWWDWLWWKNRVEAISGCNCTVVPEMRPHTQWQPHRPYCIFDPIKHPHTGDD